LQARTFDELNDQGLAVSTPQANADMTDYTGLFLDTYFNVVTSAVRKNDPNHMIIGNRLQRGTINSEQLCRIMGKYLDIVSYNYYTNAFDTDFLKKIYQWTGDKPIILSEFYWDSPSDSGLPGGVKDSGSQKERGLAYRNYVEQAAALGFIVGVEWYTLVDEPITGFWYGKYGGENGNTGLLGVTDRPWKPMIEEMVKTNYEIYKVLSGKRPPFVYNDPRFQMAKAGKNVLHISRATGPIAIDGSKANWPGVPSEILSGKRLVEGVNAGGTEAAFKLCWDDKNLYFIANVTDPTPMQNQKIGNSIWSGDAIELFIGKDLTSSGNLQPLTDHHILISAGLVDGKTHWYFDRENTQPEIQATVIPNVDGKGYTLEAAIPFSALGFTPKEGDSIKFDLALDNSEGIGRTAQLAWNGNEQNSAERSFWGTAVFGP